MVSENAAPAREIKSFAIEDYLGILRYRKWLLVIPILTLTLVTTIGSHFMTDIFRAQTTILVSEGDMPSEFVRTTVSDTIQERVATIREQVLSESLLLNVVRSYGLYPGMANRPAEELIAVMRYNVQVEQHGKNAFTISFMGTDPMVVQAVTNRLAQLFIDETVGDRVRSSRTTSEFLEQQMGELKTQLDAAEKKVAEFKSAHIGTLPEEMDSNQRNLDRLQRDLSSVSEQVTAAEDRRVLLETQMAKLQGELFASGSGDMVTLEQQIESLEAQLNQALQTLTPEHPDVKALKAKIAQLRAQMGTQEMVGGRQYRVNAVNRALFEQLQATIRNIQSLNAQRGALHGQIAALNGRVSLSPQVEQELSALTRDYDKLREAYQDLQKKHMEAQQAAELEAQQKGRQFKIIDPARFPEKPYKPNRPRLVALAMVIGLFLGLMAIFVTEHLDHSFRDDEDLSRFAGKPVLTTIPRFSLQSDAERRTRLFRLGLAAVAAGGFLLLLVVILRFGFGVHLW